MECSNPILFRFIHSVSALSDGDKQFGLMVGTCGNISHNEESFYHVFPIKEVTLGTHDKLAAIGVGTTVCHRE